MLGLFDQFFAPSRRHTEEERRRLELTLEDIGDADPGRGPINLAGGVVLIRRPPAPQGGATDS
ncbi:hypothetical protein DBP19_25305 [Streptomyces sp. CS090A]|uniref:DUF6191 domain-containing protein n=1 Tax=Streptomyces sp. CS090A TaxID=2162710 RepID=UPI000D50F143|nr:DUF6191 domain-containing protein [Streptomyces sp. CS090A]PVC86760.1 hypothetical protein DBP19_25305 [Streptomyces sp. CS090A]